MPWIILWKFFIGWWKGGKWQMSTKREKNLNFCLSLFCFGIPFWNHTDLLVFAVANFTGRKISHTLCPSSKAVFVNEPNGAHTVTGRRYHQGLIWCEANPTARVICIVVITCHCWHLFAFIPKICKREIFMTEMVFCAVFCDEISWLH